MKSYFAYGPNCRQMPSSVKFEKEGLGAWETRKMCQVYDI